MGYGSKPATQLDLQLSAAAKGIMILIWPLTVWTAIEHTRRNRNPAKSLFLWMIWGLLACTAVKSTVGFLAMRSILDPKGIDSVIPTAITWALEIHLVTQIILNRLGVILPGSNTVFRLKITYLIVFFLINVSVLATWPPAVLYNIEVYARIIKIWDPIEIVIVLVMDMALNVYFVFSVKRKLLSFGLTKYKSLIRANVLIIMANITTDVVLCISYFTFTNLWFCEQFQGLTYVFKTRIELQMAKLILRVAAQETEFDLDNAANPSPIQLNDVGRQLSSKQSDTTHVESGDTVPVRA